MADPLKSWEKKQYKQKFCDNGKLPSYYRQTSMPSPL